MITFADKPEEVSDFTSSVDDIQGKLVYTVPKGRTALLDGDLSGREQDAPGQVSEESAAHHFRRRRQP